MKKTILTTLPVAAFVAGMSVVPSVSALKPDGMVDGQPNITCEQVSETKTYNCELTGNAALDITVEAGETLNLDLKGHTLTNFVKTGEVAVIDVKQEANLVISDTSDTQAGAITSSDTDSKGNVPLIDNKGTTEIQGGKISTSRKNSPAIYNAGDLTISGGTLASSGGGTTLDQASWGLTNAGTTTITGGTFDQQSVVSLIQNEGQMVIESGTFTAQDEANALITNSTNGANPELTVEGGDFETNYPISNAGKNDTTVVNGGTFANPTAVANFLAPGLAFNDDGTVIEAPAPETPADDTKNPNTADPVAIYAGLAAVALLGLGATAIIAKKANR